MHEIEYIHVALICNYAVLGYVIPEGKNVVYLYKRIWLN